MKEEGMEGRKRMKDREIRRVGRKREGGRSIEEEG